MEQRISIVTLGVGDLARSRAFYARLGWRESSASNEAIAFFQASGMALALYPRGELAADARIDVQTRSEAHLPPEATGFAGFTIACNTRSRDEVDAVLAEAARAGARILKPAEDASWGGYSGYFADPDGFAWEVAWNPFFIVEDDGSLKLEKS